MKPEALPKSTALHLGAVPLERTPNHWRIAFCARPPEAVLAQLEALLGHAVHAEVWTTDEWQSAFEQAYPSEPAPNGDEQHPPAFARTRSSSIEEGSEGSQPETISWVNAVLRRAVRERATDLHVEPYEDGFRVRYRIDGILREIPTSPPPPGGHATVIARIKVMAGLDLGERRLPQDGRIQVVLEDRPIDLRVSILPTLHGETADVRILDRQAIDIDLTQLGFSTTGLEALARVLELPNGIVLLTGPTGSGKTTTLYACLERLRSPERKILTIEDPVEYQLPGISQIQVNPRIGLTFSAGLRSMLRHDPDIMMVGEIRDEETADVAIQVALTGHLVFSTVHTNDAASAATRLLNMGAEPYLLASSLQCVVAQRLVRVLCPECSREDQDLVPVRLVRDHIPARRWDSVGCGECNGLGYRGRTLIHEILPIDSELRELILERKPANHIKAAGVRKGMETLRMSGMRKVEAGITTLSEVLRVTQSEEPVEH